MQTLPANLVPYLVGTFIFALFCWRARQNYRRLHNPLSQYFGIIAGFVALAFGFWTIPLLFTHDIQLVKLANIVGDLFLYAFYATSALFVYYLALQNRVPRKLYTVLVLLLAAVGWLAHVYGYQHFGVTVSDAEVVYQLPTLASVVQLFFIANVLLVGVLVLKKLPQQTTTRGRLGLVGISALFILSSIAGATNIIMSDGYSNSSVIMGTYLAAFLFFAAVLVVVRFSSKSSK